MRNQCQGHCAVKFKSGEENRNQKFLLQKVVCSCYFNDIDLHFQKWNKRHQKRCSAFQIENGSFLIVVRFLTTPLPYSPYRNGSSFAEGYGF